MTIVGTRPELIRLSLIFGRFAESGVDHVLVHTGQNYDPRLSDIFFDELELPAPDVYLGIRSDRVGDQIGRIIADSEAAMLAYEPDALLILGDTNIAMRITNYLFNAPPAAARGRVSSLSAGGAHPG